LSGKHHAICHYSYNFSLENGIDHFRLSTAERILKEDRDKIYFNNCPKCDELARTPDAKQCRFCGYDWHDK